VVEGGTLLRCYTSKRGIEGSNPSSSAPEKMTQFTSQNFLWQEVVKVTYILAIIMALHRWHAVLELWSNEAKKGDMTFRLFLAVILTVAVVGL
jgi:fumarate reductase subunit D